MRLDIDQDVVDRFARDGFVVITDALDADELEKWRDVVGDAVARRLEAQDGLNNQHPDADAFYAKVFTQAMRLGDTHHGLRDLIRDPALGRLAATLVGADAVRMWHDQALVKPPHGNQTTWHRDTPYWSFHSRRAVNYWIALDDATLANGCLWYLPGTHLLGDYRLVKIGKNMGDIFDAYPEWRSIDPVPAPCPAGSIVIHNAMVVHGAGPNMTARPRRAMTAAYFPDGEAYNGAPDTLPPIYTRTLGVGDRLDDDRYVPLIWSADGRTATPLPPAAVETGEAPTLAQVAARVAAHAATRPPTGARLLLDFGNEGRLMWDGIADTPRVGPTDASAGDLTLATTLAAWGEITVGGLDPRVAFLSGRLAFTGDQALIPIMRALYA